MKIKLIAVVLGFITLSTSCSRSLDNNPSTVVVAGTWRVSLFTDSSNDETTDFTGYTFSFNSNGTIAALNSGVSQNGTWSASSTKFTIDLGPKDNTNKPLGELTDDWRIISTSDAEIKLKDDSKIEFLTFSKN